MTPQRPTIFYSVPPLLVVLAVKVLVTPRGVSPLLIWPFKLWFTFNFFQDLVHKLLEHYVNHLSSSRSGLSNKISPSLVIVVYIRPNIPFILWDHLSFPFPLLLVLLDLSMRSISWCTLPTSFLVKDFLKSCSAGRLILKVLIATSSKFPSISLNIS